MLDLLNETVLVLKPSEVVLVLKGPLVEEPPVLVAPLLDVDALTDPEPPVGPKYGGKCGHSGNPQGELPLVSD
jgi:hypothetical protein